MIFLAAFLLFLAAVLTCLFTGLPMVCAMAVGFLGFSAAALKNGCSLPALLRSALDGMRTCKTIILVMLSIGILTALWRASGVVALFVCYGIRLITPRLFLLLCFLLCSALSYVMGSSIGVAGTIGVILISIARSGGVPPALAAGAILSGVYFGDRTSPVSTVANLVCGITGAALYDNLRGMLRSAALPMALCTALYGVLSAIFPLQGTGGQMAVATGFALSPWLLLPVVLLTVLPLLRCKIHIAIWAGSLSAAVLAVLVQGRGISELLRCCLVGYRAAPPALGAIWDGGGLVSMLNVCGVLLFSSTFSRLFSLAGVLTSVQAATRRILSACGRIWTLLGVSLLSTMLFCSQAAACIMTQQLLQPLLVPAAESRQAFALELCDSAVLIASMVPWCLSFSIPAGLLGAGMEALPLIFLIYAIPLCTFGRQALQLRQARRVIKD